jgi:hypothetical protein
VKPFELVFPEYIDVIRYSSLGTRYITSEGIGMPRLPDNYASTAFFLYKNKASAMKDAPFGGTGFFVGIASKEKAFAYHLYGVTNAHNIADGATTIRLNTVDGKTDLIELQKTDWVVHPDGYDIAITKKRVPLNIGLHESTFIELDEIDSAEAMKKADVGLGDDVVMIGRFVDLNGRPTNTPAVRFGNISVMPVPVENGHTGKMVDSYLIDMHSRSGYSGSPVLVYRTPYTNLKKAQEEGNKYSNQSLYFLLGIHWGQFPEHWECESTHGKLSIAAKSGMTMVHPVSKIWELLNMDPMKTDRDKAEKVLAERNKRASTPVLESAREPSDVTGSVNGSIAISDEDAAAGDEILRRGMSIPATPKKKPKAT